MALTFLVESSDASVENPLIQKLAAWVAQGAAPPPLFYAAICVSSSPWDAALRSQALTTYDSSTASLTPDLKLTVNALPKPTLTSKRAPVTLLSAAFTAEKAGQLASSSTGWDTVPSNSSLVFAAQGSGEVSVAAALNFTPADLLPFPTYRGLWVQRAVLLQQDAGASLKAIEGGVGLGKIVTVTVQVGVMLGALLEGCYLSHLHSQCVAHAVVGATSNIFFGISAWVFQASEQCAHMPFSCPAGYKP
jgi:hypothetical protein